MKSILITDSLFITKENEITIQNAGFSITRLDKPHATEEELIEAIKGKHGYIMGGIEEVTERVILAADKLEVICFTGSGWRDFIPGHEAATKRDIKIANCPGANKDAVAEYTLALMLAMIREVFDLGRTGTKTFKSTKSLQGSTVSIIGMGLIGERVARILATFGVKKILYYSRTRKEKLEQELGLVFTPPETLLERSDVVTLHTSKEAGQGYFGADYLRKMKNGAILINCSFESALDLEALYPHLESARLSAVHDWKVKESKFQSLPLGVWFSSNEHTAWNTLQANKTASDMATESTINLLLNKKDSHQVN